MFELEKMPSATVAASAMPLAWQSPHLNLLGDVGLLTESGSTPGTETTRFIIWCVDVNEERSTPQC
jgi:hypothetical protein